MKPNEFHQIVLDELRNVNAKLDDVRTKDIPAVKESVAGFRAELDTLKKSQTWSTRLYTIIGGAIAVLVAKYTGTHN